MTWMTTASLFFAVLFGLLTKSLFPEGVTDFISGSIFASVQTMFMNSLKLIAVPVVFFSLITSIAQFGDMVALKRIGVRSMSLYAVTSIIAIFVGLGFFYLFEPGDPGMMANVSVEAASELAAQSETVEISIVGTIVGIIPNNIISPLLKSDMLQIIFLAVLLGVALGMIRGYSKPLKEFLEACNSLVLAAARLIIGFIPLAVFCSIGKMVIDTGMDFLMAIFSYFALSVIGMWSMVAVYSLMVLLLGRLNPLTFLRKFAPAILTTFSLSSASAAMPFNMEVCRNRLGISSKVCNFTIPLGTTVNMDGTCVTLGLGGLFMARIYGIELSPVEIGAMFFSIFMLSVGAPGIPGAFLVCLSVLVVQLGIPVESVSLVIGINPLISMFRHSANVVGDAAVSCIVAKKEGMLDEAVFSE